MVVHSSNFTLCSFEPGYGMTDDKIFGQVQFKEDLIKKHRKVYQQSEITEKRHRYCMWLRSRLPWLCSLQRINQGRHQL